MEALAVFLGYLIITLIYIIPLWFIVKRAGFPGYASLAALVPIINIICLWMFAFYEWPIEERKEQAGE